jgi:hypothetical protein
MFILPEDYLAMVAALSPRRRGFETLLGDQILRTGSSEAEQEAFNLRVGISEFPRFTI